MMLRPATPLAVLLFVAFALQLLAILSTPVIKAVTLGSNQGVNYGVFGFCNGNVCSSIGIGYNSPPDENDFSFSSPSMRRALSLILVVHPVACLFTLVAFGLSIAAHFPGPGHSAKYLLGVIILMFPTLLLALLAFIVDILLFIPHVGWGGWLVLAALIIIAVSSVLMCAMRRTIVSREERKRQIAENAEMNGENFYNRQNTSVGASSAPPLSQEPTNPMVNGAPGADKLPSFSAYDQKSHVSGDDDRTPLNSHSRTGTAGSLNNGSQTGMADDGLERYGPGRGGSITRGRGGRAYNGPRDQYGNPLPPAAGFGPGPGGRGDFGNPNSRNGYSNDSMNPQGFRGRGRGGYPPRGYGRGGPHGGRNGPGNGRGGIPMGAMAAGAAAGMAAGDMMGRGQRRGPAPGYANGYPTQDRGAPDQFGQGYGGPTDYGRRQSPGPSPRYGSRSGSRNQSPGPPSAPGSYSYGSEVSPEQSIYARAESPPPLPGEAGAVSDHNIIGQAIEMDHRTGSPAATPGFAPVNHPFRDSDSDFQGLVGLQQQKGEHAGGPISPSIYGSTHPYAQRSPSAGNTRPPYDAPPVPHLHQQQQQPQPQQPFQGELALAGMSSSSGRHSPPRLHQSPISHNPSQGRVSLGENNYYEDVSPRFSDPELEPNAVPLSLMPGGAPLGQPISGGPSATTVSSFSNTAVPLGPPRGQQHYQQEGYLPAGSQRHPLDPSHSYDSVQDGPGSDNSNFTSISQRGINPEWRGPENGALPYGGGAGVGGRGGGGYGMGGVPNRRPGGAPHQRELMLSGNPDFAVPGNGRGRGGSSFGRGGRGGAAGMI